MSYEVNITELQGKYPDGIVLSIVVPCFNEEEVLNIFYEETGKVLQQLGLQDEQRAEFIFVDDGSCDKTLQVIKQLRNKDKRVHYVSFSRNFGKEAALYAGLCNARGFYTAVMDADLQDPPALLPQMLHALINEGYDCAASKRSTRKNEPVIRSFFARKFYKTMQGLSDVPVVDGARDFRLMNKKYRESVIALKEKNRFTKGIFPWVGFNTKWFSYENIERAAGKTHWSFWKLFLYAIDGIVGFSTKPLASAAILGFCGTFISLLFIIFIVIRKIIFGDPVQGWASLVCIVIFLGSMQLFCMGILGVYIAKIYIEVKNRPIYIAKEQE